MRTEYKMAIAIAALFIIVLIILGSGITGKVVDPVIQQRLDSLQRDINRLNNDVTI